MRVVRKYGLLAAALVFLAVELVWVRLRGAVEAVVAALPLHGLKEALRRFLVWLPAYPTLLLFLVPLAATEPLKFFSYWLLARHQWLAGVTLYGAIELLRLALVSFVFGVSREKLLSIGWFRVLYARFMAAHDWAFGLVAPYREQAHRFLARLRARWHGRGRVAALAARLRRRPGARHPRP